MNNICSSTALVVFGATGDLMGKKIVPALWYLFHKGKLPADFRVTGVSRREFTDAAFRNFVDELLCAHAGECSAEGARRSDIERFLSIFSYQKVSFDEESDYAALAKALDEHDHEKGCSNRVLFMAVPPTLYTKIFEHKAFADLIRHGETETTHTRVIVEKPFGTDAVSAEALETLLAKRFTEAQICRADHYLAKYVLQNIPYFRFQNTMFESIWNRDHISSIEIRTWEPLSLEKRGGFYDPLGALRDVGQNHLLEMLALVTMDEPRRTDAEDVRAKRADAIAHLRPITEADAESLTFRAQHHGYRDIDGVQPGSGTETYYRLVAFSDAPRWKGVPIVMEAGKRLHEWRTEIVVNFKNGCNKVVFRMRPEEEILFHFRAKNPEVLASGSQERVFSFKLREEEKLGQYVAEYAEIIMAAALGDQSMFVSEGEIRAAWRFIDPIVAAWKKGAAPLATYVPDTDEAVKAAHAHHEKHLSVKGTS